MVQLKTLINYEHSSFPVLIDRDPLFNVSIQISLFVTFIKKKKT